MYRSNHGDVHISRLGWAVRSALMDIEDEFIPDREGLFDLVKNVVRLPLAVYREYFNTFDRSHPEYLEKI